jgi:hypothetical protein
VSEPRCEECVRLWRDYQQATLDQTLLDEEARGSHSGARGSDLAVLRAEAAEQRRVEAQKAILAHRAATRHTSVSSGEKVAFGEKVQ